MNDDEKPRRGPKLAAADATSSRAYRAAGLTLKEIAERFGISSPMAWKTCARQT